MDTVFHQSDKTIRSIRTALVICAVTIVMAILTELILVRSLLVQKNKDTQFLNQIAIQGTLSQKMVKNFYAYPMDPSVWIEIRKDAMKWEQNHKRLQATDSPDFIFGQKRMKIDSLFTAIDPYQKKLYHLAMSDDMAVDLKTNYDSIRKWEGHFLSGMEDLMELYRAESQKGVSHLENMVNLFFLVFVFLGLPMYLIFINPIIRSMQKLAKEQKRQNQNMASILENTQDLIWSVDKDFKLLTFNSAFWESMGKEYGNTPVLGESILNYSIGTLESDRALYERAFKGETFRTDHKWDRNGNIGYHELSFNPIHGEKGISGCSVYRRDETKRLMMIRELRKSRETLKEAQKIAKLGNWNWDMVKDELQWSDELYNIFEQDPREFGNSYAALMEIVHPEDRKKLDENIKKCIAKDEIHDIVHRIVLRNGSIKYIHRRGMVFYDGDGRPTRMTGTSLDVTALQNAKNEIIAQYKELQNFVYIISHNVRSPISTIQGLVALFREGSEESNKEVVEMIGHKVDILDGTIRDLNQTLTLKRVSKSSFEWVELGEILHNIQELLQKQIEISGAHFKWDIYPVHLVYGVKSYLSNILYNLILNAINYKREHIAPEIIVTTGLGPKLDTIEISVGDNGIGMALNDEKKSKIFSMYGRLSGSTIGKGLGLFLVKTQVEAMEGKIEVVSRPGKGTKFTISLKQPIKPFSTLQAFQEK